MTKHVKYISIRITTHYQTKIATNAKGKSCLGKNTPTMDMKGILSQKSETIDFHNQQNKHAMQKIITCAGI